MHENYLPLLITVVLTFGIAGLILLLGIFLGPKRPSAVKSDPFECGNPPTGPARERFAIKFYMVAILFLVFDIEAVFIYPWAVVFSDATRGIGELSPLVLLLEMVTFVAVILVGLVYAWRKGALEWGPETRSSIKESSGRAAFEASKAQ
ncbi:NADH-quinone oxidoreductase subunit A [Myxococcota bacterium]|nr:NADH-quinone oxidoreductase subunit A [Myxococcota bacterium]